MRVLAFLPVAAALVSTHERIESMKATFRGVAESAAKNGGKIEQSTRDAIQGWMDTMNGTLVAALISEKNDYQTILNDAVDAVNGCQTTRTATFANDETGVKAHATARDSARGAHLDSKNCGTKCPNVIEGHALLQQWPSHNYTYDTTRHWGKEGEAAAYESSDATHADELTKTTCETVAFDFQKVKCDALDDHVKTLAPETPKKWCTDNTATTKEMRPVAHPHTTSITQRSWNSWEAQDEHADNVYVWFNAMDQWDTTHVDAYKAERLACHDARRAHQHRVKKTHALQLAFESAFCAWSNSIDVTCNVYAGCYVSTMGTHAAQLTTVTAAETQLKAQQAALECVLCYGNQILLENTDLTQCDSAAGCMNCDPLDIEKLVPHTLIACDEEQTSKPCDDSWTTLEYNCFRAEAPPNDCTACTDPVLPNPPVGVPIGVPMA